jgi:hypothetical protein
MTLHSTTFQKSMDSVIFVKTQSINLLQNRQNLTRPKSFQL